MDLNNIKIKLTIKSIMLFEELSRKSFNELTMDDLVILLYAVIVTENPEVKITFDNLQDMLENKKLAESLFKSLNEEMEYIDSTIRKPENLEEPDKGKDNEDGEKTPARITDLALGLAFNYGIDINYIMKDMKIWELLLFAEAAENKTKYDMEDKRFWTYLNIMPHIDSKKAGGPEKLIPFPWEKEKDKNNKEKFIEKNTENIKNFFARQNKEENAERIKPDLE